MWNLRHYRLGFDPWGPALFFIIMLPNFVWSALPAPNDVLRSESVTPLADTIAQVLQIVMIAALCAVVNVTRPKPMNRKHQIVIAVCIALYFAGWMAYYAGVTNAAVILDLCLAPCGVFLLFALTRQNIVALIFCIGFAACHLIFAIENFIM